MEDHKESKLDAHTSLATAPATMSHTTGEERGSQPVKYNENAPWRILYYELYQLQHSINLLNKYVLGEGQPLDTTTKNALVESSLLHVRGIIEFLFKPTDRRFNSIRAIDTIMNAAVNWTTERQSEIFRHAFVRSGFESFEDLFARLSQDLAHIASERYAVLSTGEKLNPLNLIAGTDESLKTFICVFEKFGLEESKDEYWLNKVKKLLKI